MLAEHDVPSQQRVSPGPVHAWPTAVHAGVHFSLFPSLRSGTQGRPLQHWSAIWQTWPSSMQQSGGGQRTGSEQ
jgi:hypothetical protein